MERITRGCSRCVNCVLKNDYSYEWRPGQPSYLIENWRKNDCKTDSHILLVLPGVQATKHQSEGLDDRKQTQAVGDHERRVETELLEWLQLFTEGLTRRFSSSTKPNQHRRRRKVFDNL